MLILAIIPCLLVAIAAIEVLTIDACNFRGKNGNYNKV